MEDWSDELVDDLIVRVSESERLRKQRRRTALKLGALLAVLAVSGAAVAIVLFTHTFASFVPPGGTLSTTCATPAVQNQEVAGVVGSVVWGCGTGEEALIVGGQGTVTYAHNAPIGAEPNQYTNLYIVEGPKPGTIDNCVAGWGSSRLITTTPGTQTFVAGDIGDWWYCAEFIGTAQKAAFTVTWSQ
jgi:hypothetical protein